MDAVEQDQDEGSVLEAEIRRARAAILTAITVGNLTDDPVSKALEALSLTLAAQLTLHKASTGHLRAVSDQLEGHLAQTLSVADTQLRSKQADVMATLAPRLAVMADNVARARLWTIRGRAIALCAATLGLVILAVGGGTYSMGYGQGRRWAMGAASAIGATIERGGPGSDRLWTNLIADNVLLAEMAQCRKTIVMEGPRHACSLPVWLDPPDATPPAAGGS